MKHTNPFYLLLFLISGCGDGSQSSSDTEAKGEKIAIVKEPESRDVDEGNATRLEVKARGASPLKYQWFKDGKPQESETNSVLNLSNIFAEDAGGYSVEVSNEVAQATSQVAHVLIKPTIKTHPTRTKVVEGNAARLEVEASGTPPLKYQWFRDGKSQESETNSVLNLQKVTAKDIGNYIVKVSNGTAHTQDSEKAKLDVFVQPKITMQLLVIEAEEKEEVTLKINAIGSPPLSYQWYHKTNLLEGKTEPNLAISSVRAEDGGKYYVVVKNTEETQLLEPVTSKAMRLDVLTAAGKQDKADSLKTLVVLLVVAAILTFILGVIFLKWFRRGSKTTQIKVSEGIPIQHRDGSDRVDRDVQISKNLLFKQCKFCGGKQDIGFEGDCPECSQWIYVCSRHKEILFFEPICPLCIKEAREQFEPPIKVSVEEVKEVWGLATSETLRVIGASENLEEQETTEASFLEQGGEKKESMVRGRRSGWWDKLKRLLKLRQSKPKMIAPDPFVSEEPQALFKEAEVKEQSELTAVTDKTVTEKSNIELVDKSGELITINIKTEIGRGALSRFGEDSQFLTDHQYTLDRKGVDWIVIPNQKPKNVTLLNGKTVTSVETLKDGDELAVGSKLKKNIKMLPLTVKIKSFDK